MFPLEQSYQRVSPDNEEMSTDGDHAIEESIAQNLENEAETARLRAELQSMRDVYLRALADLDNLRKRTQQNQVAVAKSSKRPILLEILDVIDSFERALKETANLPESLTEGFHGIYKQLLSVLTKEGVSAMKSVGETFDPLIHEAVATVGGASEVPGVIVEEFSRGYRWRDELLRPAKVSVTRL